MVPFCPWNKPSATEFDAWLGYFLSMIDDSHCNRIVSAPTVGHCFDKASVGNQQVAWKEYCVEYW